MDGMKEREEIDVEKSFPFLDLEVLGSNLSELEHASIENYSIQLMVFFKCSGHSLEIDRSLRTNILVSNVIKNERQRKADRHTYLLEEL